MKKYLLITSIFLCCNAYAQLIIGDLKIEPVGINSQLKVTNIGNNAIKNITINNMALPENKRILEPNQSQIFIFKSYNQTEKEKKEQEALLDLLNTKLIH